jgi:hypothetical protein
MRVLNTHASSFFRHLHIGYRRFQELFQILLHPVFSSDPGSPSGRPLNTGDMPVITGFHDWTKLLCRNEIIQETLTLSGETVVPEGNCWLENAEGHQTRSRRILRAFRPEIGEELIRVLRPTIRSLTEPEGFFDPLNLLRRTLMSSSLPHGSERFIKTSKR